jgi:phosphoribosylcarboxyaminoimidazole (NCAIR) mutase
MARVLILMGSKSDLEQAQKVVNQLTAFDVPSILRVASAHKSVAHLISILKDAQTEREPVVLITNAGRSNAVSGMVDDLLEQLLHDVTAELSAGPRDDDHRFISWLVVLLRGPM